MTGPKVIRIINHWDKMTLKNCWKSFSHQDGGNETVSIDDLPYLWQIVDITPLLSKLNKI